MVNFIAENFMYNILTVKIRGGHNFGSTRPNCPIGSLEGWFELGWPNNEWVLSPNES